MRSHRLRRSPTDSILVLVRSLAAATALALVTSACGGGDTPPSGAKGGSSTSGSEARPGDAPGSEEAAGAADPGYQAPRVGQCFRMTPAQSRASVAAGPKVGCTQEHTAVVAYVGFVPRALTPRTPLAQRRSVGRRLCEPAYRKVVGGTLVDRATSLLTWTMFTPGRAQLERGARWVRCDVVARSGNQLVPLPTDQPLLGSSVPEQLRVCESDTGVDISCSRPHAFRVEAVYRAVGETYPDATTYTVAARARCKELTKKDGGYWQPPSQEGWRSGDRFIRCLSAQEGTG
jgi:hypothetical protein